MTTAERIKIIRNELNFTQTEFGTRIGVAPNTIASYEIGRREPREQTIKSICREFNVSYAWLKDGVGEMFTPTNEELPMLLERLLEGENETAKSLFTALAKLDESQWKVVQAVIDELKK